MVATVQETRMVTVDDVLEQLDRIWYSIDRLDERLRARRESYTPAFLATLVAHLAGMEASVSHFCDLALLRVDGGGP